MLRLSLIALLLTPGIAHAQKFLTVGEELTDTVSAVTDTVTSGEGATATAAVDGVDATGAPSVIVNVTTDLELPSYLLQSNTAGLTQDELSALYVRVVTDENGESILELVTPDTGDGMSSNDTPDRTAGTQTANLEIGECNPGTVWNAEEALCWNAFPTE